jgi:quaternary ammonium compound-resistance protein SugE
MAWIYLACAGLFEIGWPIGLKYSQDPQYRVIGILSAIVALTISGVLLWLAQREIPLGTAYAVWTGIGAAGTFAVGILIFGDASTVMRYVGVLLIIAGVITLKLSH